MIVCLVDFISTIDNLGQNKTTEKIPYYFTLCKNIARESRIFRLKSIFFVWVMVWDRQIQITAKKPTQTGDSWLRVTPCILDWQVIKESVYDFTLQSHTWLHH
jgi:hypothetical protein